MTPPSMGICVMVADNGVKCVSHLLDYFTTQTVNVILSSVFLSVTSNWMSKTTKLGCEIVMRRDRAANLLMSLRHA